MSFKLLFLTNISDVLKDISKLNFNTIVDNFFPVTFYFIMFLFICSLIYGIIEKSLIVILYSILMSFVGLCMSYIIITIITILFIALFRTMRDFEWQK